MLGGSHHEVPGPSVEADDANRETPHHDSLGAAPRKGTLHDFVFAFTRAQGTDLRPARLVLLDTLAAANFYAEDIPLNALLWWRVMGKNDFYSYPSHVRERNILLMSDEFRMNFVGRPD